MRRIQQNSRGQDSVGTKVLATLRYFLDCLCKFENQDYMAYFQLSIDNSIGKFERT